jgi:tetratricopeptide (TPR) repeat protein
MSAEEKMFQEALAAIAQGEKARARDLLTRLLQKKSENPQYWLWMSAVVETNREQIYCLKECVRLDPHNVQARRGLEIQGAMEPDLEQVVPLDQQRRNWRKQLQIGPAQPKLVAPFQWWQGALAGGLAILVIVGVVSSIVQYRNRRFSNVMLTPLATYGVTLTPPPSSTPLGQVAKPTIFGPTPLSMMLIATYTPTPLPVNTPHPKSEAYRTALKSYQRGDWIKMLQYLDQVLKIEPDAPDIYYYKGEAYRFQNIYDQALLMYNKALTLEPKFAPAYLGRARINLAKSPPRIQDARKDLEKALDIDRNLFDIRIELARMAIDREDGQGALDILTPVKSFDSDSPLLFEMLARAELLLSQTDQSLKDAQHCNELDQTYLPCYRLVGQGLIAADRGADAVAPLETFTRYEDDPQALAWLGAGYAAQGQIDQALRTFDRVLKLDSRQPDVFFQRGQIYLSQGDAQNAVADLEQAQRLNPKSYTFNIILGKAYLAANKAGNAYQVFSSAEGLTSTDGDKAEVYYLRAQSLERLKKLDSAVRDYKALLALPEDSYPNEWRSQASARLDELLPPTMTPTPSNTPQPSKTIPPTQTRWPTRTPSLTPTPR